MAKGTLKTPEEVNIYNWKLQAAKVLMGRMIRSVDYMTDEEMEELCIYKRGLIITLDNGTVLYPMSDDEGNEAGAIHYQKKGDSNTVLPTL